MRFLAALGAILFLPAALASPYRPDLTDYNLNVNQNATDPTQYQSERPNTTYTPSPPNWRALPTYTILLDKFADGDPSNNDFFKETQLRFGGDLKGLVARLDYLHGMGIRVIFMSGTPFLNMLWQADSYSPLDFSVLDPHWGTIQDWRDTIDAIHARGMYFMADFTVGTMSDLLGFDGFLNESTPFSLNEYNIVYKNPNYLPWNFTEYRDFEIGNVRNDSCQMPIFWQDDGTVVQVQANGCMASDFDQYGDMEAFGVHPDWQRQLSKFASVQDRLREWKPSVMDKIKTFSCLAIKALDIDAIRIDKATQVTVDALATWASSTRACAAALGKTNFFIPGEVTGGDTFGSLYIGRGRTPTQKPPGFLAAANVSATQNEYFLREAPLNGLDGVAFHYSIYRSLSRFLGMDGNLQVAFDIDVNFVTAWNQMFVNNDFLNPSSGKVDPRHMYGSSNFDVFRWPSLEAGTQKSVLATFIGSLVMPGIPLLFYGEEQNFYLYDNGASNYLYGRQAMISNQAWKRHGCYVLGSEQYFNMPLGKSLMGCHDDWNALDHFDPTADSRLMFSQFHHLRQTYGALQDGFNLVQLGNWTYYIERPGSNNTATEMGLWSVARSALPGVQTVGGSFKDVVWMLYTNENTTQTYTFNCKQSNWISAPYNSGIVLKNLFAPYETYTLQDSLSSAANNSKAPWIGCLPSVTMAPFSFKAFVPIDQWTAPPPYITRFVPGHDARILANPSDVNATTIDISFEFNTAMNCQGGGAPTITNPHCGAVQSQNTSTLSGVASSTFAWFGTLTNVPDGVLTITVNNPPSADGTNSTNTVDHFLLRKGAANNVMVFTENDYDTNSSFTLTGDSYTFTHRAYGADMFRYSWNFGQNWTDWANWEDVTTINKSSSRTLICSGREIISRLESSNLSAAHMIHADYGWSGMPRRVPQFLTRGPFNNWGFDSGISNLMTQNSDGLWELEIMATWPTYVQLNVWGFDDYFYGDSDGDGAVVGIIMYALLLAIPLITGTLAVVVFMWTFYGIRHNQYGVKVKSHTNYFPIFGNKSTSDLKDSTPMSEKLFAEGQDWWSRCHVESDGQGHDGCRLIWVIPKVKDLEYPAGDPAEPIEVIIFGEPYLIEVETHVLDNITYVILDTIAATIRRFPTIDIYHINDYHGSLAPIYLLPKVIPVCLSLHNAEFQGLWPLRTKEEMKEQGALHEIRPVRKHFNLLHAAASFISTHQKSVGVAGVSDKYGKRSWARYPALWTLKHVDSLPNPDPSDIAALDETPMAARDVQIDEEAKRREWAGIRQDPDSDLFVFVGRWSKQKGVDLIADVMPSLLEKKPSIQLIAVGPVIDLYGRFAAEKLARLMELYPDRVFSKPEFTALPPYLFSGADFALIPSRDEPFGLVAVEFGRKGALGVGSRLGGLGLMPGWWYPVESSATNHMLSQLTKTIKMALKSTEEERAILRARSAVQRFPVVEWRQRMEDFHKRSIGNSRNLAGANAWRESDCDGGGLRPMADTDDWNPVTQAHPTQPEWDARSINDQAHTPGTPAQWSQENLPSGASDGRFQEDYFARSPGGETPAPNAAGYNSFLERANKTIAKDQRNVPDPFLDGGLAPSKPFGAHSRVSSVESISSIVDEKSNSPLNKAIASFTDADGGVASEFVQKLQMLTAKNSEHELSIEKYLTKSEEAFFGKCGKTNSKLRQVSGHHNEILRGEHQRLLLFSSGFMQGFSQADYDGPLHNDANQPPVVPMTGLQIAMSRELGGWPLYTIVIAWDRLKPSFYVLSFPWFFFGLAFFMIGLPSVSSVFAPAHHALANAQLGAMLLGLRPVSFSSVSTSERKRVLLRSLDFACLCRPRFQQIWVAALWYWGYNLNGRSDNYIHHEYYRQTPPKVPHFLRTLFRRKLVLWFLASEVLRDYWLSGPYGRNWTFLWSVPIPKWQILILIVTFFIGVWAVMLFILTHFSKTHTWLLPVFAVGLGAPRWCQMLWGTSSLALYIPWAGHAGPYLGISLWLWLGVLDAIQGVGLGMILLQTLSRLHVCATLAFAQIIGSICVMVARATAPNAVGPGSVFPDAAKWDFSEGLAGSPMALPLFWIALVCQLIIVIGYFWFYRKEQLARP
ncbi:modular protein with glycoside hydrolase family 13 and glycosyltransferase family 5 domains [Pholiota molesta]|nr:modular protein with glycoside hydrolase family 13 and glycosyltransferase family 5 domains [Pholiota molesta]